MRLILIIPLLCFICNASFAIEPYSISANPPALILGSISLNAEFKVDDKKTLGIGASYKVPYGAIFPKSVRDTSPLLNLTGFTLTAEGRYYLKDISIGFFFGPYLRYQNHYMYYYYDGLDISSGLTVNQFLTMRLQETGVGIEAGYRWKYNDKIHIDFLAGPRISYFSFKNRAYTIPKDKTDLEVVDFEEVFNDEIPGFNKVYFRQTKKYDEIEIPFYFVNFRAAIMVGLQFSNLKSPK